MNKTLALIIVFVLFVGQGYAQTESLITNVPNRNTTTLNGLWKTIIDPFQTGYYDYRYKPYDQEEDPSSGGFYNNKKQDKRWERLEYNFDKDISLSVPGD